MRHIKAVTAGLILAMAMAASNGWAAAYIKFEGVDGEAQDKDHENWSDLVSFSQPIHKPGGGATGPSRRRGDVVLEDIALTKELDKATPKLAEAICKGRVFPKVEIHLTASYADGRRVTYLAYELKNVQITRHKISGSGHGEQVPTEEISLNYEEIKVTYTERDEDGNTRGNVEYTHKLVDSGS